MTTGVVAMNREAMAVASDCTLTMSTNDTVKHLRAVDKVFTLTNDSPAVLMVYGRLELAGVPWQTLASSFARCSPEALTLPELAEKFVLFIRHTPLLPAERREAGWRNCLQTAFDEAFPLDRSAWD